MYALQVHYSLALTENKVLFLVPNLCLGHTTPTSRICGGISISSAGGAPAQAGTRWFESIIENNLLRFFVNHV